MAGSSDVVQKLLEFAINATRGNYRQVQDAVSDKLTELITAENSSGSSAPQIAAVNGDSEMVDVFLRTISSLGTFCGCARSMLHKAIRCEQIKIVQQILHFVETIRVKEATQFDKHTEVRRSTNHSAEHPPFGKLTDEIIAVLFAAEETVAEFLDIHLLQWAADDADPETVVKFMRKFFNEDERNINLDAVDDDECTALMYCARKVNVKGFMLLFKHGADLSKAGGGGKTVLFHVIEQYAEQPLLRQNVLKIFDAIKEDSRLYDSRVVKCSVQRRRIQDQYMTALELAAATGAVEIFHYYSDKYHIHRFRNTSFYQCR